MQSVKTQKRTKEALPVGSAEEIRQLDEPTEAEKKKFREGVNIIIESLNQEFGFYIPPFQRKLYTYLFAKAANLTPPPEITKEIESDKFKSYEDCIKKYNKLFGKLPGIAQEIVLAKSLKALEPLEKEYEEEVVRDRARDELIDFIHNSGLSYPEQTDIYKGLLEQVRNSGLVAAAAN
ncbi:MAG: hypothetical protein PHQ35_06000 [Phycisphaerae bacterium]|nr:hypothetical protein [Phycisphaerae bacterium]MDD5381269.1 hypothetical protein [Phycisphaerae bacterium]